MRISIFKDSCKNDKGETSCRNTNEVCIDYTAKVQYWDAGWRDYSCRSTFCRKITSIENAQRNFHHLFQIQLDIVVKNLTISEFKNRIKSNKKLSIAFLTVKQNLHVHNIRKKYILTLKLF